VHWKSENNAFQGPKTGIKKRPCVRHKTQGRFLLNASAFYLKRKGVLNETHLRFFERERAADVYWESLE